MYSRECHALFGFCCLYRYSRSVPEYEGQGFVLVYSCQLDGGMPKILVKFGYKVIHLP